MSKATKCDRCGGFYEQGGKNVRQGWGNNSDEYDLCPDCAESFDAWLERGQMADTPERVTESGEMLHDTREQLESYVTLYLTDKVCTWGKQRYELRNEVIRWLDRQAAITEREVKLRELHKFEENHRWHVRSIEEVNQQLNERIKELEDKVRRQAESIGEWELRCESMETERDEWKGLAEKYRADSIAAQEETERYRAKLGDVLDALHEAERAAR